MISLCVIFVATAAPAGAQEGDADAPVTAGTPNDAASPEDDLLLDDVVEEVVVEGRADARREAAVLAERKKAVPVSDAVSAQEISRTPDSSASDAVKRVVSATVVENRVILRGLGGRYSGVLLNGVPLPSPDPDENTAPLDLFPTALLANLNVVKTYTPDLPGGFGGGALQIETTPYPTRFEAKLKVSGAGDSITTFEDALGHRGGSLDFLGFDDGDRGLPSNVPEHPVLVGQGGLDDAGMERIGESFGNAWNVRRRTALPSLSLSGTVGDTFVLGGRTAGYVASFGYGRKEVTRRSSTGKVSNRAASGASADWGYFEAPLPTASSVESANLSGLLDAGAELSPNDRLALLFLYTHTGDASTNRLTGYSRTDSAEIVSSRLQFVSRGLLFGQLRGEHALSPRLDLDWQANGSFTSRDEPDTRDVVHELDGGGLRFVERPGSGERFFSELRDWSGGAGIDVTRAIGASSIRAGLTGQYTSRDFDARRFRYYGISGDTSVLRLPLEEMLSAAHVGEDFELQEDTKQADAYEARLAVGGAFVTGDVRVTEAFRVIGGVRYEHAIQELESGSPYARDATNVPDSTDRDEGHVLPAVNTVYALRSDMNLRAGYSYTIARPQFRELAPFTFYDFARRRSVSGNPDLETTRIHNVDARWEWFPSGEEVLAASAFYKRFLDPIEAVIANANADVRFDNATEADVYGIELEARASLGRIASALDDLRLGTNVSLIDSNVRFKDDATVQTSRERPLQGQSPYVVNFALTWNAPFATEITALYNVFGKRIVEAGAAGLPDVYELPFHRVDLTFGREVAAGWKLKAAITNLLDHEVEQTQGGLTTLEYSPGVAGSVALEWSR